MFFGHLTSRDLRDENERLRAALQRAQDSLGEYRRREQDLVDALVRARSEARELLDDAHKTARETVERASVESEHLRAAARAEVTAAEEELRRLREVQRVLGASLQQSLALLSSVPSVIMGADAPKPAASVAEAVARSTPPRSMPPRSMPRLPDTQPRAIARSVVDPEPAVLEVEALAPYERAVPFARKGPVEPSRANGPRSRRMTPGRVAAGLVVLAFGLAAVLAWPSWRARVTPLGDAQAASPESPLAQTAAAGRTHRALPEPQSSLPADTQRPSLLSSTRTAASGAPRTGSSGVAVAIDATRPVWLRVEVDGRQTVARTLRDREHLDVHGASDVTLRAGDAGAVLVAVNGGAAAALGRNGGVVTRRIDGPAARTSTFQAERTPPSQVPRAASVGHLPAVTPVTPSGPPPSAPPPAFTPAVTGFKHLPAATEEAPVMLSAGSTPTGLPAGLTVQENEVLRAHQSYFDALRRGDQAAIGRVVARSFTANGSPPVGAVGLTVSNLSVQISGVGAVVSGTASRPGESAGAPERLLFSEVWANTDGAWQLLSVRFLPAPAAR
jgi:hypothetical protein